MVGSTVVADPGDIASGPPAKTRLTMLFDADCGFCGRTAMVLRRLDRGHRIRILALQRAANVIPDAPPIEQLLMTIHVVDGRGEWYTGGAAWLKIMDEVPALRPIAAAARTPLIGPFVERVYGWIAGHRRLLSRLLGAQACRLR